MIYPVRYCFALMLPILFSCNSKPGESKAGSQPAKPVTARVTIGNGNLSAVYSSYTDLKNALVRSDSADAKMAASGLSKSLKEMSGCDGAAAMADKISETNSLATQRQQFVAINSELIPVVKQADVTKGQIYVQYCPMANNSKGAYWLSSDKLIRNPYYGEEMLECGEVKTVIR